MNFVKGEMHFLALDRDKKKGVVLKHKFPNSLCCSEICFLSALGVEDKTKNSLLRVGQSHGATPT